MAGTHGTPPRGLNATRSPLFEGRFGRMFRNLPPGEFGANEAANLNNLHALGEAMSADHEDPSDGIDDEESGVPTLYTYFGQFIDHDLTFDPVSSLTRALDPGGLTDFRTPTFNLDNVYGRGPSDQPYMYTTQGLFQLGDPITGAGGHAGFDLPRFAGRAIIGDPRNDENSLVSQLQGLILAFHNRMFNDNAGLAFEEVQQLVRFHYQYVIVNDFLSRIVSSPVLDTLKTDGQFDQRKIRFYHWRHDPFMPVEFSAAAYRLGHSMIRPGYRLNDSKLLPIFPPPGSPGAEALTGFQAMGPGRALDWGRFIDVDVRKRGLDADDPAAPTNPATLRRLQFAYRLDTSLVNPLHKLPPEVVSEAPLSLGERNLVRGWRLRLPTGQAVARAMGLVPLTDDQIVIGKALDSPGPGDTVGPIVAAVTAKGGDGKVFADNCPLWTYILAEAALHRVKMKIPVVGGGFVRTPQLGPVGGRIVAEVFLGLLFGDGTSYLSLDPLWKPVTGAGFRLKDMVANALGSGPALHFR